MALRGAVVNGRERCTERRRAQNFSVKHSGELHVRRVLVAAGYEVATVDLGDGFAGDGPFGRRRDRIVGGKTCASVWPLRARRS